MIAGKTGVHTNIHKCKNGDCYTNENLGCVFVLMPVASQALLTKRPKIKKLKLFGDWDTFFLTIRAKTRELGLFDYFSFD